MTLLDLTLPIAPGMPVYPGDPAVEFVPALTLASDGWAVTRVALGTHTGTHVDAPAHRIPGGATVDALPLDVLVGPARILDLTTLGAGAEIGPEHLSAAWEEGPVTRLLLRTDWDTRAGQPDYFTDFPGLTPAAAEALVARSVRLLGVETPSLHPRHDEAVHRILLGAGTVVVEGLTNLRRVRTPHPWVVVLPLLLSGLDGAPCRVVALDGVLP